MMLYEPDLKTMARFSERVMTEIILSNETIFNQWLNSEI